MDAKSLDLQPGEMVNLTFKAREISEVLIHQIDDWSNFIWRAIMTLDNSSIQHDNPTFEVIYRMIDFFG